MDFGNATAEGRAVLRETGILREREADQFADTSVEIGALGTREAIHACMAKDA